MCKNIYTNFYTDFAHFLHLHILHFGLHLRPREETVIVHKLKNVSSVYYSLIEKKLDFNIGQAS